MHDIDNRLRNLIVINAREKISEADIKDDSSIIDNFGYHSLLTIKLIVEIEKEFDIEIEEERLTNEFFSKYKNIRDCVVELCK